VRLVVALLAHSLDGRHLRSRPNRKWRLLVLNLRSCERAIKPHRDRPCLPIIRSFQVNKKKQVGAQHPDRDEQFRYITETKARFLSEGLPVISVDTKKKELVGNYR
jgi:Rhodopirellula transposase DDE domain